MMDGLVVDRTRTQSNHLPSLYLSITNKLFSLIASRDPSKHLPMAVEIGLKSTGFRVDGHILYWP